MLLIYFVTIYSVSKYILYLFMFSAFKYLPLSIHYISNYFQRISSVLDSSGKLPSHQFQKLNHWFSTYYELNLIAIWRMMNTWKFTYAKKIL